MSPGVSGVGVVYWPALDALLAPEVGLVDLVEIEPQSFWIEGRGARAHRFEPGALARIRSLPQPKIIHSVGAPIGSARLPDAKHLAALRETIALLEPLWVSEHLSSNRGFDARGAAFDAGFLVPPRQSWDAAEAIAAVIRQVSSQLGVRLCIETGVNYLRPRADEMRDGEFIAAICQMADCDILLDVHNLYANARNGRQPVLEVVAELPLERVREVHVAGGLEHGGFWVDAHSGAVPDAVLGLTRELLPSLPEVRALTLEIAPANLTNFGVEAVRGELTKLREIWDARRGVALAAPVSTPTRSARAPTPRTADAIGAIAWEDALAGLVAGLPSASPLALELAADPGVALYRELVDEVRAGHVADVLPATTRLLVLALGVAATREVLREFWREGPPSLFAAREGEAFAVWLRGRALDVPCLDAVAAIEAAALRTLVSGEATHVIVDGHPEHMLAALASGHLPERPTGQRFALSLEPRPGTMQVTLAALD